MAKIFVLEDDKDIREVIEWTLESEDYGVVSFDSVSTFMGRDISELPDLFILDIMLLDGSGLDVCKMLNKDKIYQHIPILMMSAHASIDQINMCCKANGFIQKPFELGHFLTSIKNQIDANSTS